MKHTKLTSLLAVSLVVLSTGLASGQSVENLRGGNVDDPIAVNEVFKQKEGRITRNYRQQPPLVPHSIDQYQIDLKANRCLSCHDWTRAGERGAPTLSMTHYLDRDGNQLDAVAGTRWFCNQCHVPQVNAPALVENDFSPSSN